MADEQAPKPINPTALSLSDTARLMAKVGFESVSESMLEQDVANGAPTNADGTINLVHYAAWLVRESADRSPESAGACRQATPRSQSSRLQTTDYGLPHGD